MIGASKMIRALAASVTVAFAVLLPVMKTVVLNFSNVPTVMMHVCRQGALSVVN